MIELIEKNRAITPQYAENGIEIYDLSLAGTYRWYEDMRGAFSTWSPLCWRDHSIRQWFFPNCCESVYQFGSPLFSVIDACGNNLFTLSLSDSVVRCRMTASIDDLDQNDQIIFTVTILDNCIRAEKDGRILLRVDRRAIGWDDSVREAGAWMRSFLSRKQIPIPENAKLPLYSSWYNFHQEPEQSLLEKELEAAAKIGFKTFILDDGWQFEGNNTGNYEKCGDWHVAKDKFPDFKAFCDKVHSFGIKMLLWFPVPFAGFETEDYIRLKDKMAFDLKDFGAGVLDVRYPEIRSYITGIYKRFVNEFGIDGLKLDFIDAFKADPSKVALFADGMDTESLDEAVRILMNEIYAEMTAIDPDFMFEFRQNYVGAEIVNHCSMLRVADCAADSMTNRIGSVGLRLVNAGTAIHSDMLLWAKNEAPVNCARQLLNIAFTVPQISVRLTEIPEDQLKVLQRFISYWSENREVLLSDNLKAAAPDMNYTRISAENENKKITVLYAGAMFEPSGMREDVFNNTDNNYVLSAGGKPFSYRIFDMYGAIKGEGRSDGSPERFCVPCGGMIEIIP